MRRLALAFLVALAPPAPAAANELYVANQLSADVSVIDTDTSSVVADVDTGGVPFAVAVSPDGRRVYVTDATSGNLRVIDTATRTLEPPIDVGGVQGGVAVAPDGSRVYVASGPNTVAVVDAATSTVIRAIAVDPGPRAVAVSPDGRRVYVTSLGTGSVSVIDADSGTVTATIPVGSQPVAITVTPDGRRVYVASAFSGAIAVIDTATNAVVQQIPFAFPFAVAAAPDGARVYAVSDRLAAFGIPTASSEGVVLVGGGVTSVAVSPDGTRAYLPRNEIDAVAVVDTVSMRLLQTVGVGSVPAGAAIAPDRGPTAAFAAAPGGVTELDAAASSDPDSRIVRYDWDFGDGTRAVDGGPSPSHVYAQPGAYDVTLTVTNAEGCSTTAIFTGQTASCDGGPKATTTQSVAVGTAPPPDCDEDSVAVPHASATAIALSCHGQVAALRIVDPPRHGRLAAIEQRDRTVVYTPDGGFSGTDRIRFAADGPGGSSDPATIALSVRAARPSPPAPPAVAPARPPEPAPTPPSTPRADQRPPRVSRLMLSRQRLTMRVSERATVAIRLSRCRITRSGSDGCRTVRRLGRRSARRGTVRIRFQDALRRGRYRITVRAADRAGNCLRTSVIRSVRTRR